MHIIFGDSYKDLPDSYTILELDTFRSPSTGETLVTHCLVETIPLPEFQLAASHKKIHTDLIDAYRKQHWNYCEQAIEQLMGKWNHDLDSFYTDLLVRVNNLRAVPPDEAWTGYIDKEFIPV